MKKIAITGNIGCGKSWVCTLFERLGIPVFYSDPEAKRLYYRVDIREAMMQRFGMDIYLHDGQLDKQRLSSYIFNDPKAMLDVERLLYPALNAYFDRWAEIQTAPYVLYESAIIFEKHLEHRFDAIIVVSASEATRLRRVMLRDHCDEATVRQRMAKQWPEEEKTKKADYIILHDADDEDDALLAQVLHLHEMLQCE